MKQNQKRVSFRLSQKYRNKLMLLQKCRQREGSTVVEMQKVMPSDTA